MSSSLVSGKSENLLALREYLATLTHPCDGSILLHSVAVDVNLARSDKLSAVSIATRDYYLLNVPIIPRAAFLSSFGKIPPHGEMHILDADASSSLVSDKSENLLALREYLATLSHPCDGSILLFGRA